MKCICLYVPLVEGVGVIHPVLLVDRDCPIHGVRSK